MICIWRERRGKLNLMHDKQDEANSRLSHVNQMIRVHQMDLKQIKALASELGFVNHSAGFETKSLLNKEVFFYQIRQGNN